MLDDLFPGEGDNGGKGSNNEMGESPLAACFPSGTNLLPGGHFSPSFPPSFMRDDLNFTIVPSAAPKGLEDP